jgi:hypothetical protein
LLWYLPRWSSPFSGLEGALTELGVGSRAGEGGGVGELVVGIGTLGDGTDIPLEFVVRTTYLGTKVRCDQFTTMSWQLAVDVIDSLPSTQRYIGCDDIQKAVLYTIYVISLPSRIGGPFRHYLCSCSSNLPAGGHHR